jgi:hypothetical protein
MTADELVEAVALAIWNVGFDKPDKRLPAESPILREHLLDEARAAIRAVHAAMMEPSGVSIQAAIDTFGMPPSWEATRRALRASLAASPLAEVARDD